MEKREGPLGGGWRLGRQARPWPRTWGRGARAARLLEALAAIGGAGERAARR